MTIYARNDVLHVSLSRSHGGCGQGHSRPVENGAPVKTWAFDECPACERVLLTDPLWSRTMSQLPETHDEKLTREDEESRGKRDAGQATAQALKELSSLGQLPEIMAQLAAMMNANKGHREDPPSAGFGPYSPILRVCENSHSVPDGNKFCGECGGTIPTGKDSLSSDPASIEDAKPVPEPINAPLTADDLGNLSFADLKTYATEHGIKTTRSRDEQLKLIVDSLGN